MADRRSRIEKQKMRRRQIVMRTVLTAVFLVILLVAGILVASMIRRDRQSTSEEREMLEAEIARKESALSDKRTLMAEADTIAAGYDYDRAIDLLMTVPDYESDPELIDTIAKYTAARSTLQSVDVTEVPHIYFHSLINDTKKAFDDSTWSDEVIGAVNAWMVTTEEFDAVISEMYERGYVLIRMRDLVTERTDDAGNTVFSVNTDLKLPVGKKPYILSVDDWNYYHSYEGMGFATRAVINDAGEVKCEYYDKNRVRRVGDYDVVPRLNTFIKEHPDAAYKGARGIIALTGDEGVFGLRTDPAYGPGGEPNSAQQAWLSAQNGFVYAEEVAKAKEIAKTLKEEGWEFACHTYSHEKLGYLELADNQADQEKWQETVGSIVGETDIIAFTRDGDIADWHEYDYNNQLFAYYSGLGYRFFLTQDTSTPYWIQIRKNYVRQGRIDVDGFQMYRVIGERTDYNVFEELFDVYAVFSEERPVPIGADRGLH